MLLLLDQHPEGCHSSFLLKRAVGRCFVSTFLAVHHMETMNDCWRDSCIRTARTDGSCELKSGLAFIASASTHQLSEFFVAVGPLCRHGRTITSYLTHVVLVGLCGG